MKSTILVVDDFSVCVHTEIGSFIGHWCSSLPQINKDYLIELDSPDVILPSSIRLSSSTNYSIEQLQNGIRLIGHVDEVSSDILYLRLKDSIIMLEISSGNNFVKFNNKFVEVTVQHINIYDTEII